MPSSLSGNYVPGAVPVFPMGFAVSCKIEWGNLLQQRLACLDLTLYEHGRACRTYVRPYVSSFSSEQEEDQDGEREREKRKIANILGDFSPLRKRKIVGEFSAGL